MAREDVTLAADPGPAPRRRSDTVRRLVALLALTAGPAAAEAVALRAGGLGASVALAPQASAVSPLGVFHDLRWIFVYHDSWLAFAAELLAGVAVRSALVTAIVVAAWPADRPRPPARVLWRDNVAFTALAVVVLAPWAAVTVMAAVTSLSWFLAGALAPVLLLAAFLQRGGVTGRWWRGLPSPAALGWAAGGVVAVTAGGVVLAGAPGWWSVPVAALLGGLNGALWLGLVRTAVVERPALHRVPVTPVVMALALGSLPAMSGLAPAGSAAAARPTPPLVARGSPAPAQAVMYVAGYDSIYSGASPGDVTTMFSYTGVDGRGRPLPYTAAATHQSLTLSARRVAAQVAALHRSTGRRVALIAQSEGTLVVRAYLDTLPHPDVEAVVLLSPLLRPSLVYYPPRSRQGWGVATGWQLRAVAAVVRATSGARLSADEPFLRSLLDDGGLYRHHMLRRVPDVRMVAFVSTDTAIADPPAPDRPGITVVQVPGLHGELYNRPDVRRRIIAFLGHDDPSAVSVGYYPLVQRAAAAWQAPPLCPALNPVWRARGDAGLTR